MPTPESDLAFRLLLFFHHRIPASLQPWSLAMIAELSVIEGFWNRLRWSIGGTTTLLRARLRIGIPGLANVGHGLDVKLVAAYQFLFSIVLIGIMTWQLPRITESWKYAVPVLIMCYAIAALPAVLGFGLTLLDESARLATILFTIAHALFDWKYLHSGFAPYPKFTVFRIALDVLIIVVLNRRAVRLAFQLSPVSLHLHDDSFSLPAAGSALHPLLTRSL